MEDLSHIKVSVIMSIYNVETYVLASIQSILAQTHSNLELIVIDDCSTDNTLKIVKSVEDPRLIIIPLPKNRGTYFCRNRGLKAASGEMVAFQDGDDVSDKKRIATHLDHFIKNPNIIMNQLHYAKSDDPTIARYGMITIIYPRWLNDRIGYYDESMRYGADCEFINRVILYYGKQAVVHVKTDYFMYIAASREGSLTKTISKETRELYLAEYRKQHAYLKATIRDHMKFDAMEDRRRYGI